MAGAGGFGGYDPGEELTRIAQAYFTGSQDAAVRSRLMRESAANPKFAAWLKRMGTLFAARRRAGGGRGASGASPFGDGGGNFLPGVERNLQAANSAGTFGRGASSPGGFKKSGQDADSALRRSGTMTPDAVLDGVRFFRNPRRVNGLTVKVDGRTLDNRQIQGILSRGRSGATMNWRDQAVYDAYVRNRRAAREQEAAAAAERASAERRQSELAANAAWRARVRRNFGIGGRYNPSDADLADIEAGRKVWHGDEILTPEQLRMRMKESQAQADAFKAAEAKAAKEAAAEAQRRAFNARYGVPEDVVLTDEEGKRLAQGKARWGLSAKDEETRRKLEARLDELAADPNTGAEDLARLREQVQAQVGRFAAGVRDADDTDGLTGEQLAARARQNMVVLEDPVTKRSRSFMYGADGKLTPIDFGSDPKPERPQEETWNGMKFSDFLSNYLKNSPATRIDEETREEVAVPYEERLGAAKRLWDARESIGAPEPGGDGDGGDNGGLGGAGAEPPPAPKAPGDAVMDEADAFFGGGRTAGASATCPVCGAELAADGTCPVCGYPDTGAPGGGEPDLGIA